MQRSEDSVSARELRPPDIQPAVDFIAIRYVEANLLDPDKANDTIAARLSRPGRIVFVAGEPIKAAGCLVIRHKSARVTCLASVSPVAVIVIFEAIGERLLSLGIVSLRAKVHPKYARFYQRVIGAEVLDRVKKVDFVCGADGINIRLHVDREVLSKLHSWSTRVLS